ncbi:MAG TPA: MerR family transcriptional regulator [Haliangiales bacterium]|nr:MerR family transcriptional regulator [Haliangiales bacterium]
MTIGQLARDAGLRPSALRYYEAEGLLPAAPRVAGRRVYDAAALDRLRLIAAAQRAGFTVREIRGLLRAMDAPAGMSAAWHARAHDKLVELDAAMGRIRAARRALRGILACGCDRPDQCVIASARTRAARAPAGRSGSLRSTPAGPR